MNIVIMIALHIARYSPKIMFNNKVTRRVCGLGLTCFECFLGASPSIALAYSDSAAILKLANHFTDYHTHFAGSSTTSNLVIC